MFSAANLQLPTGQLVDLNLKPGEIHCLRGDSGVGKTRLLRVLADLDVCEGETQLNSTLRSAITAPQWRSQVMLVPAKPRWWFATAAEHMALPMNSAAQQIKLNAAAMTAPSERLSTGESTRLALLRALSREPAVLLLDEPTAALDEDAEAAVESLLKDYVAQPGRCILWVTHSRAQAARIADVQWHLSARALERLS